MALCNFSSPYLLPPQELLPSSAEECCKIPPQLAIHVEHLLWHLRSSVYTLKGVYGQKRTSKSLPLLQRNARRQPIPILPHALRKLKHNLLSRHYTRILPPGERLLRTRNGSLELLLRALRDSRHQIIRSGVTELNELRR